MNPASDPTSARQAWMSLLAKAPEDGLARLWSAAGPEPAHRVLRAPETGAVMVRGRAGAVGAAFNLGEMTVTRCSVRLEDGTVGHGYVQGRSKAKAMTAALVDALMQTAAAPVLEQQLLQPLRAALAEAAAARSARAAATKVDFFTMVRGED
ncbi:phosphonate C-P lyase system protein PhnG [Pseudoruegeria sp. SK021]|uniref:phosphonate C-P lyase system protein PhnG n=1 Tax=Pseudoruegeria sp. SK021 TaxID=1933035 RepID=UPI000A262D7D|nr:phosphonate C-P lyase system protein PhnG [Pseudoruegeria sp. SK021]OSP55937.1 phosphonate C-P lyase system protein PhnG [Pseudoruegeria sp. SK021]